MSFDKVNLSYPGLMPAGSPKADSVVYVNDDGSGRLLIHSQETGGDPPSTKVFIQMAGDAAHERQILGDTYTLKVEAVIDLDSKQWLNDPTWVDDFHWFDTLEWEDTDTVVVYNGTTLERKDLPAEGAASDNYFLSLPTGYFNPGTSQLDITVNGVTRRLVVNRTIKRNTA